MKAKTDLNPQIKTFHLLLYNIKQNENISKYPYNCKDKGIRNISRISGLTYSHTFNLVRWLVMNGLLFIEFGEEGRNKTYYNIYLSEEAEELLYALNNCFNVQTKKNKKLWGGKENERKQRKTRNQRKG